jgi:hypothetical protein
MFWLDFGTLISAASRHPWAAHRFVAAGIGRGRWALMRMS